MNAGGLLRRGAAVGAGIGMLAAVAGCGASARPSASFSTVPAPSRKIITGLVSASAIVKTQLMRWPQRPPEELVVSKQPPASPNQIFQRLGVAVMRWSPPYHNWNLIWRGNVLPMQQGFQPGHPVVAAISSWKTMRVGNKGLMVGLVDPASLGASILWGGAELLWIPAAGQPRTLWSATGTHQLIDGSVVRQRSGLMVTENACWAVQATPNRHQEPIISHPDCTALLAHTPGRHLAFTVAGSAITPQHASVTVPVGSTVVFWPANPAAVQKTNSNALVLLGGPANQAGGSGVVANDFADTVGFWSWSFRSVGTYRFALTTNRVYQSGVNPPVTWTVRAVAGT